MPKQRNDPKALSRLFKVDCQKDMGISCRFKCRRCCQEIGPLKATLTLSFILRNHGVRDPGDPLNLSNPHGEVQPTWA